MNAQDGNDESLFQERLELLIASGQANQQSVRAAHIAVNRVEAAYDIRLTEEMGAFLVNHIAVTLKRLMDGEALATLPEMAWDELRDYPEECALAQAIVTEIERELGIPMSRDEVGFIAVHLFRIRAESGAVRKG
jgi:transcriptional regulatory protein LevR